jgi:hypothetical protein
MEKHHEATGVGLAGSNPAIGSKLSRKPQQTRKKEVGMNINVTLKLKSKWVAAVAVLSMLGGKGVQPVQPNFSSGSIR